MFRDDIQMNRYNTPSKILFSKIFVTRDLTISSFKNIYFFFLKNDFARITSSPCRTRIIEGKQTLSRHPFNNARIMAVGKYGYYYSYFYFRFRLTGTAIRQTVEEKIIIKTVSIRTTKVVTLEIVYTKSMKSFYRDREDVVRSEQGWKRGGSAS